MSGETDSATQRLALSEGTQSPATLPAPIDLLQAILRRLFGIKSPVPNRGAFITLQHDVRTSGQVEQLQNVPIPDGFTVVIKAHKSNSGTVTIGAESGAALNTSQDNWKLAANESIKLGINNLNLVYLDVTVSGEGVEIIVEQ